MKTAIIQPVSHCIGFEAITLADSNLCNGSSLIMRKISIKQGQVYISHIIYIIIFNGHHSLSHSRAITTSQSNQYHQHQHWSTGTYRFRQNITSTHTFQSIRLFIYIRLHPLPVQIRIHRVRRGVLHLIQDSVHSILVSHRVNLIRSNIDIVVYRFFQFTLVDCPGHASLIKTIIGGA